jgi:peptidoglycan hydrolase CwlO-like protein
MLDELRKPMMLAVLFVTTFFTASAAAQTTAQEQAAKLRAQLNEVQARQTELQARLERLEEDLKPENIQNSLAGVGSTHPEELREQRRRQLETERKGVQAQLDQLAASRTRLETAIAEADARAYHESARGPGSLAGPQLSTSESSPNAAPANGSAHPAKQKIRRKHRRRTTRRM